MSTSGYLFSTMVKPLQKGVNACTCQVNLLKPQELEKKLLPAAKTETPCSLVSIHYVLTPKTFFIYHIWKFSVYSETGPNPTENNEMSLC